MKVFVRFTRVFKMGYSRSREGNLSGPLTTALDSLKDLRDQIRFVFG